MFINNPFLKQKNPTFLRFVHENALSKLEFVDSGLKKLPKMKITYIIYPLLQVGSGSQNFM